MKTTIKPNARTEEIIAYKKLGHKIFCGDTFVGDAPEIDCPDLYQENKKVGAEVVTCETAFTYRANKNIRPQKLFNIKNFKIPINAFFVSQKREYYKTLKKMINHKLVLLNKKMYKGCKKIYLIIVSINGKNNFIEEEIFKQIIKQENKKFKKNFKNVFLITNNKTFYYKKIRKINKNQ